MAKAMLFIPGRTFKCRDGSVVTFVDYGTISNQWPVRCAYVERIKDGRPVQEESIWTLNGDYQRPGNVSDRDILDGRGPVEISLGNFRDDAEGMTGTERKEAAGILEEFMEYHSGQFKIHLEAIRTLAMKQKILNSMDNNDI